MAESEDERRRGDRIPINDEFAPLGGSAGSGSTWVSDLSHGGVFVHTDHLLPVGSMVDLRFTILIDDPVVIEAFAKVVRHSHKPRGMGVQFAAMSPEMTERIADVIDRRRPLDSGDPLRLPEPTRGPVGLPDDDDDDDDDGAPVVEGDVAKSESGSKSATGDESGATTIPRTLARPAPVEGLVRRVRKQEFEDAVTAAFPKVSGTGSGSGTDTGTDTATSVFEPVAGKRFKAPPLPSRPAPPATQQARPRETKDEDRTRVYQAIPVDDD